jgi:EAL domain-containing protein (putative c-di-GMP-specific phosphodiesterase class I)
MPVEARTDPIWLRRVLAVTVNAPKLLAWQLTVVGLGLCWAASYLLGGEQYASPVLVLAVVVMTGIRFGWRGALVTSVAAGVLVGPLLPADVGAGTSQSVNEWASRLASFVILGQLVAFMTQVPARAVAVDLARLRRERDILNGLDRGEFRLVYQPIVMLDTERVAGIEALVRWEHPDRGAIPPVEFISVAEESTAITAVGRFVLAEACRQVAVWKQTVLRDTTQFTVSVNVAARQLADPIFPEQVANVIHDTGLDPSWLSLEVTETALIADLDAALDGILAVKALGVRLAIDDFGTGYSSLSYLHRLPVDSVKIDRSFVTSLSEPGMAGGLAALVIQIAADHDITTVAEGVETMEQIQALRALGCEYAQGYYFSEPLDPATMLEKLAALRLA